MFYRTEQDDACTVCKILYLYITLTFLCLSSYNLNGTIQPDILFAHIIKVPRSFQFFTISSFTIVKTLKVWWRFLSNTDIILIRFADVKKKPNCYRYHYPKNVLHFNTNERIKFILLPLLVSLWRQATSSFYKVYLSLATDFCSTK